MSKPFLSVVIPVYNESKRLGGIPKLFGYLKKQKHTFDVHFVNDGSIDNTYNKLRKLQKKYKFNLISYDNNHGKGYAIKKGMLTSNGKYRLFMDVDLSTPIEEFDKFKPYINKYPVIIGSRKMKGAKLKKRQNIIRENLGKGFTMISQVSLSLPLSDFTCGFKCFESKAANNIFAKQNIDRWGFDSEILFISQLLGYKIKEVPITWIDNHQTKVRFPKDLINSFKELMQIRINHIKGVYK